MVKLTGAKFRGTNLTKANLPLANLSGADLSKAILRYANLSGANLDSANLTRGNLSAADLSEANLSWTDLTEANLSGAKLTGANTTNSFWPRGFQKPTAVESASQLSTASTPTSSATTKKVNVQLVGSGYCFNEGGKLYYKRNICLGLDINITKQEYENGRRAEGYVSTSTGKTADKTGSGSAGHAARAAALEATALAIADAAGAEAAARLTAGTKGSSSGSSSGKGSSRSSSSGSSGGSRSGSCSGDFSCGRGEHCVKAPGHGRGECMKTVDRSGTQIYIPKRGDSYNPGKAECNSSSDCPYNFKCDSILKACVQW